jgi:hypothetical protein
MRAKLTFLSALAVSTFSGLLAAGCQTYDFEPVAPLAIAQTTVMRRVEARERKPNLMLLVDTSRSMIDPMDASNPRCRNSSGEVCGVSTYPCNTADCPTRWSALQEAMEDFLASSSTLARIGLAFYPHAVAGDDSIENSCKATASVSVQLPAVDVEDDDSLAANARAAWDRIFSIKNQAKNPGEIEPQGGTPISASLQYLSSEVASLRDTSRANFVVLLTDGLPNCNAAHATPYPNSGCFCTIGAACQVPGYTAIGCLDDGASVNAVKALQTRNIKTIVIGFGADFDSRNASGARGAATLNAMALEGGFTHDVQCSRDADCGADDTCDTTAQLCRRRFYLAIHKEALVKALEDIRERVGVGDPCMENFDAGQLPASQDLVVVYVNKERLEPGSNTWNLVDAGIQFNGTTCQRIKNSTPANPVNIEVRAIQGR